MKGRHPFGFECQTAGHYVVTSKHSFVGRAKTKPSCMRGTVDRFASATHPRHAFCSRGAARRHCRVHCIPAPNLRDVDTPLLVGRDARVVRVIWSKRSGFIFAGGTGPSPSVIYPTAQPVLVSREKHRSGSSDFSARAREAHHCGGSGGECGANASFSFDVERTT